jgi:hypothetical protein
MSFEVALFLSLFVRAHGLLLLCALFAVALLLLFRPCVFSEQDSRRQLDLRALPLAGE